MGCATSQDEKRQKEVRRIRFFSFRQFEISTILPEVISCSKIASVFNSFFCLF